MRGCTIKVPTLHAAQWRARQEKVKTPERAKKTRGEIRKAEGTGREIVEGEGNQNHWEDRRKAKEERLKQDIGQKTHRGGTQKDTCPTPCTRTGWLGCSEYWGWPFSLVVPAAGNTLRINPPIPQRAASLRPLRPRARSLVMNLVCTLQIHLKTLQPSTQPLGVQEKRTRTRRRILRKFRTCTRRSSQT